MIALRLHYHCTGVTWESISRRLIWVRVIADARSASDSPASSSCLLPAFVDATTRAVAPLTFREAPSSLPNRSLFFFALTWQRRRSLGKDGESVKISCDFRIRRSRTDQLPVLPNTNWVPTLPQSTGIWFIRCSTAHISGNTFFKTQCGKLLVFFFYFNHRGRRLRAFLADGSGHSRPNLSVRVVASAASRIWRMGRKTAAQPRFVN